MLEDLLHSCLEKCVSTGLTLFAQPIDFGGSIYRVKYLLKFFAGLGT